MKVRKDCDRYVDHHENGMYKNVSDNINPVLEPNNMDFGDSFVEI